VSFFVVVENILELITQTNFRVSLILDWGGG